MVSVIHIADDAFLLFNSLPAIKSSNFFIKRKSHLFGNAYLVLFNSENAFQQLERYIKKHLLENKPNNRAQIYQVSSY